MEIDSRTKIIGGVILLAVFFLLSGVKGGSQLQSVGVCALTGLLIMFAGIFSIRASLEKYRLMQNIMNIPTSKAHSAAVGLAEFHGKAFPLRPMVSPISKEKCAYYYLDAQYFRRIGKSARWHPLFRDMPSDPFYIEDETGRILVNPSLTRASRPGEDSQGGWPFGKVNLSKIDLQPANTFKGRMPASRPQPDVPSFEQKVFDYVNSSSHIKARFIYYEGYTLLIREYYIPEGQEVYVIGSALPIEGSASSMGSENLVVREAKEGGLFYIGTLSEAEIVAKMKDSALIGTLGGLLVAAIGLLILLSLFL